MDISDQLREAIRSSGKSANVLAREAGVTQPTISTFLLGKDIRLVSAARLAAYLGLTLQPDDGAAKPKIKAPAVSAVDRAKAKPEKKRMADSKPAKRKRS